MAAPTPTAMVDQVRGAARQRFLAEHLHLIVPVLFSPDTIAARNHALLARQWARFTPPAGPFVSSDPPDPGVDRATARES